LLPRERCADSAERTASFIIKEDMKLETGASMGRAESSFLEAVKQKSGEDPSLCYQCLKCTAGCRLRLIWIFGRTVLSG